MQANSHLLIGAIIWFLMFLLIVPLFAEVQNPQRSIHAKWVESPPIVDGQLSEKVWQHAQVASDFFRAKQGNVHPAQLKTEARVLYDAQMLYIGVWCEEPVMGNLRETQTRRDSAIWQDDCIEIMLDTYHDGRNCYIFGVNTQGTQMDERVGNESIFDMSWDAKWKAKVVKNKNNWTAEFAIPFREIRFNRSLSTWGINFWRAHPIDSQSYSWARTAFFSRVSEFGMLRGLDLSKIEVESKLGFLPYATYRDISNQPNDLDGGADFILPVLTNMTANITFNPDFSQLESDPTQINVSSDRELFLPERRPFFREGAELFKLPLNLFYTRRVQEIDLGAKAAGKIGKSNFAIINTYGKLIDRYDNDVKKQANLLVGRVNYDIGEKNVIGLMGVQKHQEDRGIGLLSLDGRFGFLQDWTLESQYALSFMDAKTHWAYKTALEWIHEGWTGEVRLEEIQEGFRPNEIGLEEESFRNVYARLQYNYQFSEGNLFRSFWINTRHFYQTNAQRFVRERLSELELNLDIGRFELLTSGGVGVLREVGRLYDIKFIQSQVNYLPPWGRMMLLNRFGRRQDEYNRFTSFSTSVNILSKFTISLDFDNFFWRAHRNTFIFRLHSNYQFVRNIGFRIFLERVYEQIEATIGYNFNAIFDYEFTPESHFFLVFVDSSLGQRSIFIKYAYLFEYSPNMGPFNFW